MALDVADSEGGIAAVTMRRVGERLGVEAMSLYHHVANKEALLDAMVDAVFAEVDLPVAGGEWVEEMRRRCASLYAAMLRHRWAIGLTNSRRAPGPATLRHHDAVLACLRAGGMPVRLAGHAFAVLDSFVYGFVLQDVSLPFDESDDLVEVLGEIIPDLATSVYTHLDEYTREVVLRPGYRFADEFAYGLDLILGGLVSATRAATSGDRGPADAAGSPACSP